MKGYPDDAAAALSFHTMRGNELVAWQTVNPSAATHGALARIVAVDQKWGGLLSWAPAMGSRASLPG